MSESTELIIPDNACSGVVSPAEADKRTFIEQVFRLYRLPLQRHLRSSGLSDEDIEEIQQEAYIRLLNQPDIERIKSKIKGYLFTVATNLMIDRARRNKVRCVKDHTPLEDETLLSDAPHPDECLSMDQSLAVVRHAIKELQPKHRQAFLMSRFMQMEHADIAIELGVSARTIERRVKFALEFLRHRLENRL